MGRQYRYAINDSEYWTADDGCTCVTPETCFFDDIIGIRFLENGKLLPETPGVFVEFPLGETSFQTGLRVDFDATHAWNEQDAEDTAKGIFSLVPTLRYPKAKFPEIKFIGDRHARIPLAAILNQVGDTICRTSVSADSLHTSLAGDVWYADQHHIPHHN
jgi:hypothetical protein